jgi:hypothetical protein
LKLKEIIAISLSIVITKEGERRPILSPNEEVNPLQKYVDALDNPASYTPSVINATQAQYLIKALDYLKIWSQEHHDVTEEPLHEQVEAMMVDIVAFGPEN